MVTSRSWKAMVLDADPDYYEKQWVYKFRDRYFYQDLPYGVVLPAGEYYLVDAQGNYILTADGKKIVIKR